jgi:hypothetical protein
VPKKINTVGTKERQDRKEIIISKRNTTIIFLRNEVESSVVRRALWE